MGMCLLRDADVLEIFVHSRGCELCYGGVDGMGTVLAQRAVSTQTSTWGTAGRSGELTLFTDVLEYVQKHTDLL